MYTIEEMMAITKQFIRHLHLIAANHMHNEGDRDAAIRILLAFSADFYGAAGAAITNPTNGLNPDEEFTQKEVLRMALFLGEFIETNAKNGFFAMFDFDGFSDWRAANMKREFNTSAFDDFIEDELFEDDDDNLLETAIS